MLLRVQEADNVFFQVEPAWYSIAILRFQWCRKGNFVTRKEWLIVAVYELLNRGVVAFSILKAQVLPVALSRILDTASREGLADVISNQHW